MWIFTNNAFLSVVEHRNDQAMLMVRARMNGDIERVFPEADVSVTPNADYRFRAVVTREAFTRALLKAADSIDYPNFKNSVSDDWRHSIYSQVWGVMHRAQQDRARGARS